MKTTSGVRLLAGASGALARAPLFAMAVLAIAAPARARAQAPAESSPEARAEVAPPSGALARTREVLAQTQLSPEQRARALAQLGPGAVGCFLGELEARWNAGPSRDEPQESEPGAEALALALARLADAARVELRARLDRDDSLETRAFLARVVGEIGNDEDVSLLVAIAVPRPRGAAETAAGAGAPEPLRKLEAAFASALERLLRRDARCYAALGRALQEDLDERWKLLAARGVAGAASPRGLELFAEMLARPGTPQLGLLIETGRLAACLRPPFEERVLASVRAFLEPGEVDLCREAALCAGKLEDPEAVPALIELLRHEHRGVRANAVWSLQRICAVRLQGDPAQWEAWLAREERWNAERAPDLIARLRAGSTREVMAAIREIAQRRWRREELASELTRVLWHRDPEVVRFGCAALTQLRARSALPALIECLESGPEEAREAAWKALESITGERLPPDPAAWRARGS